MLKNHAKTIFDSGVLAANPYQAVKNHLILDKNFSKIHLIAFGKAACNMTIAAQSLIPQSLVGEIIVVTNYENVTFLENATVIGANHPLPDNAGFLAAQRVEKLAINAQSNELVLVLISGGGSALLPYPVDGVSLEEKIVTTQLLLSCGATINEINCVRKHLSKLKGGQLAKLIAPADCYALILSDVLDDDLSAIASGATVADETTYENAIAVLNNYDIWEKIPNSVKNHLQQGENGIFLETPKSNEVFFAHVKNQLIGSNAMSVTACQKQAELLNYETHIFSHCLSGEAREVAKKFVSYAQQFQNTDKPIAILAGGETTVTLKGKGKGGRNQEMALAFALAAEELSFKNWVFLSGGTDGIDGVTDAAGGLVDKNTIPNLLKQNLNPFDFLDKNDSYHALKVCDNLLMTGSTGTNVADLQIFLAMNESISL